MNSRIAFVTGADRGLGLALCKGLLARGWQVFAGQYMPEWPALAELAAQHPQQMTPVALDVASLDSVRAAAQQVAGQAGHVDLLINNAGIVSLVNNNQFIRTGQDYSEIHRLIDVNSLGPMRMGEAFLPLMDSGAGKRLCFVSSEAGSVTRSQRKAGYGYSMSKAALNMAVKIMFNDLRPLGFTFRVYHPGWLRSYMSGVKNEQAHLEPDEAAVPALTYFLSGLEGQPCALDEETLVLRDHEGQEWPW